jgi:hypothetical protein
VHPTEIENGVDLPDQMIGRNDAVQIKRIKELTLSAFPPSMSRSRVDARFNPTESSFVSRLNRSFATQSRVKMG